MLAGLKRATAKGKRLGRLTVSAAKERAIRADVAAGLGFRKIMARNRVGTSVIQRLSRKSQQAPER